MRAPESTTAPSIADQVLPQAKFGFVDNIDLMDETLREGAERATVPPTIEAKAELAEAIARAGIRSIVVGMFPDVPHNIALLAELAKRQMAGRIPPDVRFLVISHVGITFTQTLEALERMALPGGPPASAGCNRDGCQARGSADPAGRHSRHLHAASIAAHGRRGRGAVSADSVLRAFS